MGIVKPGDIYLLAEPKLRASSHNHYCIVLRLEHGNKVLINFLSSDRELFDEQLDIMLRSTDEEFEHTGLKKDTFIINQDYARLRVPVNNLFVLQTVRVGYVSGEYKRRIEDYFGEKL